MKKIIILMLVVTLYSCTDSPVNTPLTEKLKNYKGTFKINGVKILVENYSSSQRDDGQDKVIDLDTNIITLKEMCKIDYDSTNKNYYSICNFSSTFITNLDTICFKNIVYTYEPWGFGVIEECSLTGFKFVPNKINKIMDFISFEYSTNSKGGAPTSLVMDSRETTNINLYDIPYQIGSNDTIKIDINLESILNKKFEFNYYYSCSKHQGSSGEYNSLEYIGFDSFDPDARLQIELHP